VTVSPVQDKTSEQELRVVVDAQIVLSMFLARRDRPELASPKRQLLRLLPMPSFQWLWTPDIISDYERGAEAIESSERIMQRAMFDRVGFQLFLAALQLSPPVAVSVTTTRQARRRISQATRKAERDLDDAVYLACAVDGQAHLLTTEDSDLRSLGDVYEGVSIVSWHELQRELSKRKLTST
jgi:predicted nucleic acid-binding protein